MIKNVFFDLDGTLLPMEPRAFVERYIGLLCQRMAKVGKDPALVSRGLWAGTLAMMENRSGRLNCDVFWETFEPICPTTEADRAEIDEFYRTDFQLVRSTCGFEPEAAPTVRAIRGLGLRVVLATNPVFPREATYSRVRWAGLEPGDFELVTTYENSRWSKPAAEYYQEICGKLEMDPRETLMVGNDTNEDASAVNLGMDFFLLPKYLIDREKLGIDRWPHGDYGDLLQYIQKHIRNT